MTEDHLGSLRFIGDRFEQADLAFELGIELSHFQILLEEVASGLYRADHPDRERVPRGFSKTLKLFVGEVSLGSTDVAYRGATRDEQANLFEWSGVGQRSYAERALERINDVYSNPDSPDVSSLSPKAQAAFLRFGKTFKAGEEVELGCATRQHKVSYGLGERSRLTSSLRSFSEVEEQLIGHIADVNVSAGTFKLDTGERQIGGSYDTDDWHDLLKAELEPSEKANRVLIEATVRYKTNSEPRITQVKDIYVVEKQMQGYDVATSSLDELETNRSVALSALGGARQLLQALRFTSLRAPTIFLLDDGGIHFEWQVGTEPTYIDFESDGSIDAVAAIPNMPLYREFESVDEVIAFVTDDLDQHLDTDTLPAVTV